MRKALLFKWLTIFATSLMLVALSPIFADTEPSDTHDVITGAEPQDLSEASLEYLLNIEVTSVSRRSENLAETSAAVYVVTQEDIRRSGATSIPEALRMVPGLQVGHIDANKWAVTSRGFADRFVNKMLVLIDGRSVYTPLFSGVWWDVQDTMIEDIERIEVIRGPGATMWGANAVNGIINIITKDAHATQGALMAVPAGTLERGVGSVRYGGMIGTKGHYRVYAKRFDREGFVAGHFSEPFDRWNQSRGGFRVDFNLSNTDTLSIHGDVYSGEGCQSICVPLLVAPYEGVIFDEYKVGGGNLQGRWTRATSPNSESVLQFYYDRTKRDDAQHNETRATYDIDFQHRRAIGSNRELMYGIGYRLSQDNIRQGCCFKWIPDSRTDRLYSAFVQGDIHLRERRDRLTLGTKLEHNDYTGWELQPNIRYFRSLDRRSSLWAAVSRAARTPSRSERTGQFDYRALPGALPGVGAVANVVRVYGNPDFVSEKLTAYELGYRIQPNDKLALDIAAFCNVYDDLRTLEQDVKPFVQLTPVPHVIVPFTVRNNMKGTTYGLEIAGDWRVSKRWRIAFGYGNLVMRLKPDQNGVVFLDEKQDLDSPRQQFKLRSYLDLSNNLEFDTMIYAVDRPSADAPGYVRLDLRLGWAASDNLEVSVGVQNLLQRHHVEFGRSLGESPTEVPRSFYTKLSWQL